MPYPITAPSGPAPADRLRVQQEIRRSLAGRGLLRAGVLDAELEELIQLLGAHATAGIALSGPLRAIAAADGYSGVLATLRYDTLDLRPIRPGELAAALVSALPAGVPGSTGVAAHRPSQLGALLAGSLRSGCFGRAGGSTPSFATAIEQAELVWFDLPEGRYLATREDDRLIVIPANDEAVLRHVCVLLDELVPACWAGATDRPRCATLP